MKFPYGICDFYKISTNRYFFIDRTDRIPLLEDTGDHLLFLRPRRFGKSLLLSTLRNYYDLANTAEFEKLFGHLAIGRKPTPKHSQYFVLKWDFSAVSSVGDARQIQQALYNHINGCIEQFSVHYRHVLAYPIPLDPGDALRSFQSVLAAVQQTPYKLYLFIDEYDNFANDVLMSGQSVSRQRYEDLLSGEGVLKTVFKAVKSASEGQGLDKVFITGVSPVVMSDITSGYNIAQNISLNPEFNDVCGFWEAEIRSILEQLADDGRLAAERVEETLALMRTFYNGYAFAYDQPALMYNPTLALYFLAHLQRYQEYPREILDANLATDRAKIEYIARLPGGGQVIAAALNEAEPLHIKQLAHRFGVNDMLQPQHDNLFMASLLYYLGVLTMSGESTATGSVILKIPNLVVRRLYVEQLQELVIPAFERNAALQAAETFYTTGNPQPLCAFIEQRCFKVFDNRDYRWTNELTIKTAFLILLFDDTFYIMDSETAVTREYADLTMIVRPDMRKYQLLDILIEFKYVSLAEAGFSGAEAQALSLDALKALPPVQRKLAEAQAKLAGYRRALQAKYGDRLRLRTYGIAAVGFERLVWQEVSEES